MATATSPERGRTLAIAKACGLVLLLTAAIVASRSAWSAGLLEPGGIRAVLDRLGAPGPAGFLALKVIGVVLALPAAPMSFLGGALFGPVVGTVVNLMAATTGAAITFFLGRGLGQDLCERLLSARLRDLDARLAANGFWVVLVLRLVPLVPFNAINYGAGLTRIRFPAYIGASAIGMIPGTAAYTYLGHAASELSPGGVALGLGALGLLALIPLVLRWRKTAMSAMKAIRHRLPEVL